MLSDSPLRLTPPLSLCASPWRSSDGGGGGGGGGYGYYGYGGSSSDYSGDEATGPSETTSYVHTQSRARRGSTLMTRARSVDTLMTGARGEGTPLTASTRGS